MLLKKRAQDAHLAATERLVNGSRGVVVGFVRESLASPDCAAPPFSESDGGRGGVSRSGGGEGGIEEIEKVGEALSAIRLAGEGEEGGGGGEGSRSGEVLALREKVFPVVLFVGGRTVAILPEVFEHAVYGLGSCKRVQVPLKLSLTLSLSLSLSLTHTHTHI
jgi:hypothetical protein